ncbi:DUF4277 domain-containing protein [Streptomyces olivoreticuli]
MNSPAPRPRPRRPHLECAVVSVVEKRLGALPVAAAFLRRLDVVGIVDELCPGGASALLTHGQVIKALVANRLTSPAPLVRVGDWPVPGRWKRSSASSRNCSMTTVSPVPWMPSPRTWTGSRARSARGRLPVGTARRAGPCTGHITLTVVAGRRGGDGRRHHPGRAPPRADLRRRGGGPDRRSPWHTQRAPREAHITSFVVRQLIDRGLLTDVGSHAAFQ